MDRVDVEILRELFRDARASYAELAHAVHLSPNAVKARVKRLRDSGVLQGIVASPRAALLGLCEGLFVFTNVDDLAQREEELLRGLPDVPGVRFVDVGIDGTVLVWVLHKDDADWERLERATVSLVGKPPASHVRADPAPLLHAPRPSDWRLLRALLHDGAAPLHALAKRAGVSAKTARRRLRILLQDELVRIEPVLSPTEAQGLVLYTVNVILKPDASPRDLLALLPEGGIAQTAPGSPFVALHAARATLREAQADHRHIARSPHVERALFSLATRRRADGWLADALDARLKAVEPTAPLAPLPLAR